jgi:beta-lactamase regulating signal transducer with metallopeptidase domain
MSLLETVLSNTLAAGALAGAAWFAGRVLRRPAAAHGLWILVLLKLCTPPLFFVPVFAVSPDWLAPAPAVRERAVDELPAAEAPAFADAAEPASPPPPPVAAAPPAAAPVDVGLLLAGVSLAGSAVVVGMLALRVRRLASLLRYAQPATAPLRSELAILCRRLGIARPPLLQLVPGCVTPMLWGSPWRARVLLPAELCARMSAGELRSLLAHELAHLRRRDHQVRWLELCCAALFWWHPLVWLAARALRTAEEECCDAWVVWALPGGARAYADALVKTVQFLSGGAGAVPVAATGIGPVQDLNRRLTMIMKTTTPRSLSRLGRVLVFATALAVLPTLPAFAQDDGGNKRRNQEVEQMLQQNREHPERVKEALGKLMEKHKRLVDEGKSEEAEAVGKTMERLERWLVERANEQAEQRKRLDGQDDLLDALKKAVHALREQDDEAAAKTLARFAEELARKRQQAEKANESWRAQKGPFLQQEANRSAEEKLDGERKWKAEELDRVKKQWQAQWDKSMNELQPGWPQEHRNELPPGPQPQDHRIDELAQQVERLTKIVEQLAGRMEENEKKETEKKRVSR